MAVFGPIVIGPNLGGEIDIHAYKVAPWLTIGLAALAFVRRERAIWWVLGVVFAGFYVVLHLIAIP
jgi:hypothetical protein